MAKPIFSRRFIKSGQTWEAVFTKQASVSSHQPTFVIPYLFRVVLMQTSLAAYFLPQTQYFIFRAVRHVDHAFVPPSLAYHSVHRSHDQTIVPHFDKQQRTRRVDAHMNGETLSVTQSGCDALQVNIITMLRIYNFSNVNSTRISIRIVHESYSAHTHQTIQSIQQGGDFFGVTNGYATFS